MGLRQRLADPVSQSVISAGIQAQALSCRSAVSFQAMNKTSTARGTGVLGFSLTITTYSLCRRCPGGPGREFG